MNTEKISKLIKDIRTENKLSQQKFADKYGVTFQAVSKWETGKNIPDIMILKKICEDYNIDFNTLFIEKKKKKKIKIIIPIIIIILIAIIFILILKHNSNAPFEFKTLSTTCNDFNLFGTIAYNKNKTSIHISNITYCGGDDNYEYLDIIATLYETNGKTQTEIRKYHYNSGDAITLEEFLQNLNFNVDHYDKTCSVYKENSLILEIEATKENGSITTYKIPLSLEDNCNK